MKVLITILVIAQLMEIEFLLKNRRNKSKSIAQFYEQ